MNTLFSYLRFWWRSKNEHAVHSPFVFKLITDCFYNRSAYQAYQKFSNKDHKAKFLVRLGDYFKHHKRILSKNTPTSHKRALGLQAKPLQFKTTENLRAYLTEISKYPSLIYLDSTAHEEAALSQIFKSCHRDSLIVMPSIGQHQKQQQQWKQLKAAPEVSVSIDLFHWGLLFFRTEQPKQHFTIRL